MLQLNKMLSATTTLSSQQYRHVNVGQDAPGSYLPAMKNVSPGDNSRELRYANTHFAPGCAVKGNQNVTLGALT